MKQNKKNTNTLTQAHQSCSISVVRWAGPGAASRDGWVVNVFQQEKPSFRARRAVWSRQLSPAPASAPPSLQPTQEEAHGHKFESLTRCGFKAICISLSLPLPPSLPLTYSLLHIHYEMSLSFTLYSLLPRLTFHRIPVLMKMESSFS